VELSDLKVDGDDLRAAGIPAGPPIGAALNALLDRVLDNPALNDRQTLLRLLRDSEK
jgi:tRNA nucleotidyltransferase (CCA-adding enzyme)